MANFEELYNAIVKQDVLKLIEIRDIVWDELSNFNGLAENAAYMGISPATYKYFRSKAEESRLNWQFITKNIPQQQG